MAPPRAGRGEGGGADCLAAVNDEAGELQVDQVAGEGAVGAAAPVQAGVLEGEVPVVVMRVRVGE